MSAHHLSLRKRFGFLSVAASLAILGTATVLSRSAHAEGCEEQREGIVRLVTTFQGRQSKVGTGFVVKVNDTPYIITAAHNVSAYSTENDPKSEDVTDLHPAHTLGYYGCNAESRELGLMSKGTSQNLDIAILQYTQGPHKGIQPVTMSEPMSPQGVWVAGFPELNGQDAAQIKTGNLTSLTAPLGSFDRTLERGFSGAPLRTKDGKQAFGIIIDDHLGAEQSSVLLFKGVALGFLKSTLQVSIDPQKNRIDTLLVYLTFDKGLTSSEKKTIGQIDLVKPMLDYLSGVLQDTGVTTVVRVADEINSSSDAAQFPLAQSSDYGQLQSRQRLQAALYGDKSALSLFQTIVPQRCAVYVVMVYAVDSTATMMMHFDVIALANIDGELLVEKLDPIRPFAVVPGKTSFADSADEKAVQLDVNFVRQALRIVSHLVHKSMVSFLSPQRVLIDCFFDYKRLNSAGIDINRLGKEAWFVAKKFETRNKDWKVSHWLNPDSACQAKYADRDFLVRMVADDGANDLESATYVLGAELKMDIIRQKLSIELKAGAPWDSVLTGTDEPLPFPEDCLDNGRCQLYDGATLKPILDKLSNCGEAQDCSDFAKDQPGSVKYLLRCATKKKCTMDLQTGEVELHELLYGYLWVAASSLFGQH